MGNADLEEKLAALKKTEAELADVEAQIHAEREHINEANKAYQAEPPDPDDPIGFMGYSTNNELDELIAGADQLKLQIGRQQAEIAAEKVAIAEAAKPSTDLFTGLPPGATFALGEPETPRPETDPITGLALDPAPPLGEPLAPADTHVATPTDAPATPAAEVIEQPILKPPGTRPTSPPPLTGESGLGYELAPAEAEPVAAATDTRRRVVVVGALVILALLGAGAVVARFGSSPSPSPTPSAPAVALATPTAMPTATLQPPTIDPGPQLPISYSSDCNGACFMTVDPVSCDRTFHFMLSLLYESAHAFDGKTAIISTVGPGLQPTYEVPVVDGKVTLDAVAKGSDYGGNPNAGCAVNAHWTGLLTSVDGNPTTTPNAPT